MGKEIAKTLGVSNIQKIFEVERKTVLKWCHLFKEYLPAEINRKKDQVRVFSKIDLMVFAYVSYHWEENPDLENIKIGLNLEEHKEDLFFDFANKNSPLFGDIPGNPEERADFTLLLGGMGQKTQLDIARIYKSTGDILVDHVLKRNNPPYEVDYSILFMYRHSIELYLKEMQAYNFKEEGGEHNIENLLNKLEVQKGLKSTGWIRDRLIELSMHDPYSMQFRYGDNVESLGDELYVDLYHLRSVIDDMILAFEHFLGNRSY